VLSTMVDEKDVLFSWATAALTLRVNGR